MLPFGIVLAYHGCDREIGERVLAGRVEVLPSTNDYDWLGSGAYFWEGDPRRALEWARFLQKRPISSRGSIREPFAIGAIILPGLCSTSPMPTAWISLAPLISDTQSSPR